MESYPSRPIWNFRAIAALLPMLVVGWLATTSVARAQSAITYRVNSTSDAGDRDPADGLCFTGGAVGPDLECTFRAAIEQANALTGPFDPDLAIVEFADVLFPTGSTHVVLTPATPYPTVRHPMAFLGETAKPHDPLTPFARPYVTLLGTSLGAAAAGLHFGGGSDGSYVGALAIAGFPADGILIDGADAVIVQGNWLGVRGDGVVMGNASNGIRTTGIANATVIGGPLSAVVGGAVTPSGRGNLIAGNGSHGIQSDSRFTLILGNRIGTDPTGTGVDLGRDRDHANGGGGIVVSGQGNEVGGEPFAGGLLTLDRGNLVSGNALGGVFVLGSSPDIRVVGNRIGTDASGTVALGNGAGPGISVNNDAVEIGGLPQPLDHPRENVVSGNVSDGVLVYPNEEVEIIGNRIGVSPDGEQAVGNGGAGIRLIFCYSPIVESNWIGGNAGDGVRARMIDGALRFNHIGVSPSGADLGNGGDGVRLTSLSETSWVGATFTTTTGAFDPAEGNEIGFNGGAGIRVDDPATIGVRGNALYSNGGLGLDLGYASQGIPFAPVLASGDWDEDTQTLTLSYTAFDFGFGGPSLFVDFYVADADGEEPVSYLGTDVLPATGALGRSIAFTPVPGSNIDVDSQVVAVAMEGSTGSFGTFTQLESTEVSNAVPVPEPGAVQGLVAGAVVLLGLTRARRR